MRFSNVTNETIHSGKKHYITHLQFNESLLKLQSAKQLKATVKKSHKIIGNPLL